MLYTLQQTLEKEILNNLNFNCTITESKFEGADLALSLFKLSKDTSLPLPELAKQITAVLLKNPLVQTCSFVNGFLNICLKRIDFSKMVIDEIINKKEKYGSLPVNNQTVVLDYSAPNIAKSFSVGHLRSTVIGNSLAQIYKDQGYKTVSINYLGDWGTQFGNMIVAYNMWKDDYDLKNSEIESLQDMYIRFHKEAVANPSLSEQGRNAFHNLELKDKAHLKLWERFRQVSLLDFNKIYELLNIDFDVVSGESEYNDKVRDVITDLENKSLLVTDSDARVVFLNDDMPPALIAKSDGSSLYITRDLAALKDRFEKYHFAKALYVVGGEQKLHFTQLKLVAEKLGYPSDIEHISFGLILQNGKKMSTRRGNGKKLNEVISEASAKALQEIEKKNSTLKNKEEIALKIATSALIFFNLKNDRNLVIDFNLNEMLQFEGQTGPYLQYSVVRIKSILKEAKTKINKDDIDYVLYNDNHYFPLIFNMAKFPQVIKKACLTNSPDLIAKYLLQLAQQFNQFYANTKVIVKDKDTLNANLAIITSLKTILEKGLKLLGLAILDEM